MADPSRIEFTVTSKEEQDRLNSAIGAGAIIVDRARRRPFYFDGRFLTAADLIADQDYIRARQSDLAQAMGAGIIAGLMVSLGRAAASNDPELVIDAGSGITPGGDLVVVGAEQRVRLTAIPEDRGIDAQLGIKQLSSAGVANRSGLFVLALRPVEFTSNPVPAYPTTLDGTRSVHDGDIIEATAVTLIPYPDRSGVESAEAKRARVAREIFYDGQRPGALQEALPLAMVCIEGGSLRWLDVYMVRREIGAESTLAAGLRQRPRALLEAWVKQHQDQIDDIGPAAIEKGFTATRYFEVLPPVGLIPASALKFETQLDRGTLTQSYFPPLVDCELAFAPSDEIASLVEDALALPPVDLSSSDEDLDHLSLLIVAPVTRQDLEQLKRNLESVSRVVRAAAPGMLAKRLPLESLVRIARPTVPVAQDDREKALAQAWQTALTAAQNAVKNSNRGCFWYLRRRQLPYHAEISSATLRLAGNAATLDTEVNNRMVADKTEAVYAQITGGRVPKLAAAEVVNVLAAPRLALSSRLREGGAIQPSDLLRRSALHSLRVVADVAPEAAHAAVLDVARAYGDPRLGEGFDALLQAADEATRQSLTQDAAVRTIAESGLAPELDRAARLLPVEQQKLFSGSVARAAAAGDTARLKALVRSPLEGSAPPR